MKKKIIAILVLSMLLIAVLIGCDINVEKRQISTGDDSMLKTLILTDIRFDGSDTDLVREKMISKMVKDRNPEFIAISGNIVNARNNGEVMKKAVSFIDSLGIPWATSIGELDVAGDTNKKQIMRILTDRKLKNSMVMRGENYKYNYVLEIVDRSNKVSNLLYFVDTAEECSDTFVEWFQNTVINLSFKYKEVTGQILNTQVFMNRPLPVYADAKDRNKDDIHPWENGITFQKAIINNKLARTVLAGFDMISGTLTYETRDIRFVYVKPMNFDSSMTGDKYNKQKTLLGCSSCDFSSSTDIRITPHTYLPDDFVIN